MDKRLHALLALSALGWSAPVASEEPAEEAARDGVVLEQQDWLVRTARLEGAVANVREAASAVKRTADAVGQAGRLTELARLDGEATLLEKKVIGLRLAAEVLDEPVQP